MGLQDPCRRGEAAGQGEPGVGVDLPPPFAPYDETTRWLFGLNRFGIRPGLERISALLRDLGDPQLGLTTLVVAGTNGKGSTTRILARLLRAAGLRTATYTSPHLLDVTERIQIDERSLDRADFSARAAALRPAVERHEASWFETLTALAVQAARDAGADVLCCEAGMGGRLDASNALPAAAVLLTSVGLDHQQYLGRTRQEIAAEKLGLLKSGAPLFCGVDRELRPQVFAAAVRAGSPSFFLDEVAHWGPDAPGAWSFACRGLQAEGLPDPGMAVLRRNVALALLALSTLGRMQGRALLPADPAGALRNLFLPGRFQLLLREPDVIIDTAHNGQALQQTLSEFLARPCRGRRTVLFAGMRDKELPQDLGPLLQGADAVLAAPVCLPRSRSAAELAELLEFWGLAPADAGEGRTPATVLPDLGRALQTLAPRLRPQDALLATGSCFCAAEVLHRLGYGDLESTRIVQPARRRLPARTG